MCSNLGRVKQKVKNFWTIIQKFIIDRSGGRQLSDRSEKQKFVMSIKS